MSREHSFEEVPDPTYVRKVYSTKINCDVCGRTIDVEDPPDGDEELYAQELIILLNIDLCVNSRVRMDLCRTCLRPIWDKICNAIGQNPEDELRVGQ